MKRLSLFVFDAFPTPNRRPLRLETLYSRSMRMTCAGSAIVPSA
jgi:hypothetical protein